MRSQNALLEQMVEKKTIELQEMLHASIYSMALMAEIRDPYTAGHQQRVAQLASAIAAKMGLSAKIIEGIRIAGILHDVGKIRIPVSILNRMGQLLKAELEAFNTFMPHLPVLACLASRAVRAAGMHHLEGYRLGLPNYK